MRTQQQPSNRKKFIFSLCGAVLLFCGLRLTIATAEGYRLGINISESLPELFFVYKKVDAQPNLKRLDKVVFKLKVDVPKEYGFHNGSLFVKQVVGVEDDMVTQKDFGGYVSTFINGRCVANAYKRDRLGNVLTIFSFKGAIPKDYVFVNTTHPYSFDSRYFGLVKKSEILGIVTKGYL